MRDVVGVSVADAADQRVGDTIRAAECSQIVRAAHLIPVGQILGLVDTPVAAGREDMLDRRCVGRFDVAGCRNSDRRRSARHVEYR